VNLYNGDCLDVLGDLSNKGIKFDAVITSPPYNVSRRNGDEYSTKYNSYKDTLSNEEYIEWQTKLFHSLDKVLNENGVILYNINYGGENTDTLWLLLANIIQKTNFTVVDQILWKKSNAIPNNVSRVALTRIVENVFVICRKTEKRTFMSNKRVISISKSQQKIYENVLNFIEAPNNDGGEHTKVHKASYSFKLCEKLINMYVQKEKSVLDPFMGTGTTGVACKALNREFTCIELDKEYYCIARDRIERTDKINTIEDLNIFFE